ncbi:MAG TPA: hypothetical protein VHU91_02835, partial [Mycobacteriales bacterium]|nr:hypothetical protein [Mycobacteriales bacterium]
RGTDQLIPRPRTEERLPDRYNRGADVQAVDPVKYPRVALGGAGETYPIYQAGRPENASRSVLPVVGGRASEGRSSNASELAAARPEAHSRPPVRTEA